MYMIKRRALNCEILHFSIPIKNIRIIVQFKLFLSYLKKKKTIYKFCCFCIPHIRMCSANHIAGFSLYDFNSMCYDACFMILIACL